MDKVIFVDSNFGRFANQLFPLFAALTIYERDKCYSKIYFKNYHRNHMIKRIPENIIEHFSKELKEVVCFDDCKCDEVWEKYKNERENLLLIRGYCQDINLIDVNILNKYFYCPKDIEMIISNLYGDLSDYICLHVRRGDYLHSGNENIYPTLTPEYINRCIEKHFPCEKVICISDDMNWCKVNLSGNSNIIFADKCNNYLVDFYIQSMTKGNICSSSSFSVAGSIINPYRKMIIPSPFFKRTIENINLYPSWSIKEIL